MFTVLIIYLHCLFEGQNTRNNSLEKISTIATTDETVSFKEQIEALHSLPPMPETASEILKLKSMPDVAIDKIVEIIEKDPALVAQIVNYANSAFFGLSGTVKSLKIAIFRVLGIDATMNMALALSVGSTFKIPKNGPVGSQEIWKSSIYTASLMQRLSMLIPWGERPDPGTAYLVGLLYDVGLLVLGHLFTDEYLKLNAEIENNNEDDILQIEQNIFSVTHLEVGKIVMHKWNMPEELITVTTHFNDNDYSGEHEKYIQLLSVVKTLLTQNALVLGDYPVELAPDLLAKLGLEEENVMSAADEVLKDDAVIQQLAKQMC